LQQTLGCYSITIPDMLLIYPSEYGTVCVGLENHGYISWSYPFGPTMGHSLVTR